MLLLIVIMLVILQYYHENLLISYRWIQSGFFCVWSVYPGWLWTLQWNCAGQLWEVSLFAIVFFRDLHLHWKIFGIHKQKVLKITYIVFQMVLALWPALWVGQAWASSLLTAMQPHISAVRKNRGEKGTAQSLSVDAVPNTLPLCVPFLFMAHIEFTRNHWLFVSDSVAQMAQK